MQTRMAGVAGIFYPDDAIKLNLIIKELLTNVKSNLLCPKAIIVPHAGYIYSGQVAASIYSCLQKNRKLIKKVILIGPAHKIAFKGIAGTLVNEFNTPLGNVVVNNEEMNKALSLPYVQVIEKAFFQEHCLEVQLPFLQYIIEDFQIVPFLVGKIDYNIVAELINKLWGDCETLIVISSDLSHFNNYKKAQQLDKDTSKAITSLQPNDIKIHHACGQIPIQGLLKVAKERNLLAQTIDLCNSGDIIGNKDKVVGYGAYHFA